MTGHASEDEGLESPASGGLSILQVVVNSGSTCLLAFDAKGQRISAGSISMAFIDGVHEAYMSRRSDADGPMVAEFRRDGSAWLPGMSAFGLESISPTHLVLDRDHRHPHHPPYPMTRPAPLIVTDRVTPQAILDTVRGLVAEFVELYTAIKGRPPDLGVGHAENVIHAAENAMGLRLPDDLRALYRTVREDRSEHGLLGVQSLLPLEMVVSTYLAGVPGSYGWNDDLFSIEPIVFETVPAGHVRRLSRSDWWVTFASDRSGDWCAVDLDPGPLGTSGQVLEYGQNISGQMGYVAESVTAILRQVVTALRAGRYEDEPELEHLRTSEPIGAAADAPYSHNHQVLDRAIAAIVSEFAEPLDVQELYLHDAATIDLAELAPLRNLRVLSVNRASTITLSLPHDLPTEELSIDGATIDLAPISGHPTLWKLTLKGDTTISIAPLTTMPALAYLDLSGIEVTDLDLVGNISQLAVLALNHQQWQQLRERAAVPTTLAGAVLAQHTSLADAVEWANWLRRITDS